MQSAQGLYICLDVDALVSEGQQLSKKGGLVFLGGGTL